MSEFEQGTKEKVRFDSSLFGNNKVAKGSLTIEDLWDLPLKNKKVLSLNKLAKAIHRAIKDEGEEDFVGEKTERNSLLELQFAIVKRIIKVKLEDIKQKNNESDVKTEKQKLARLIMEKEDEQLKGESLEELRKKYNAL